MPFLLFKWLMPVIGSLDCSICPYIWSPDCPPNFSSFPILIHSNFLTMRNKHYGGKSVATTSSSLIGSLLIMSLKDFLDHDFCCSKMISGGTGGHRLKWRYVVAFENGCRANLVGLRLFAEFSSHWYRDSIQFNSVYLWFYLGFFSLPSPPPKSFGYGAPPPDFHFSHHIQPSLTPWLISQHVSSVSPASCYFFFLFFYHFYLSFLYLLFFWVENPSAPPSKSRNSTFSFIPSSVSSIFSSVCLSAFNVCFMHAYRAVCLSICFVLSVCTLH